MMSDIDADGIYELTLSLDRDSTYEYKFINGNEWGNDESLLGALIVELLLMVIEFLLLLLTH